MNYNILVAEDDDDIIELLRLYLENDHFTVFSASGGLDALDVLENNAIDIAVVDIMMPQLNGFELIKRIRKTSNMPVIVLSAKNGDSDKILGLNLGADDYLAKPFNPLELIARIKSCLRRSCCLAQNGKCPERNAKITVGTLTLDTEALTLQKGDTQIALTPTEYKILALLMKSPGRVYTKVQIYENINGEYFESDDNTMMVHMSKLREKIEDDPKKPQYIITVRGLGYKIEKQ